MIDLSASTSANMYFRLGVQFASSSGLSESDLTFQVSYEACGSIVAMETHELIATSTSAVVKSIGGWMPAITADKVKAAIIVSGIQGANFQVQLVYRTATASREDPGSWTSLDTLRTGAGEFAVSDQTLSIGGQMWVQFGIKYILSSGSLGGATVSTTIAVRKS